MKKCIIALCVGLFVSFSLTIYADSLQKEVAQNVLRLHVLANSDSAADQDLKLSVRDRLLAESGTLFAACKTREESCALFLREKKRLEKVAAEEISSHGFSYPVRLSLEKTYFPTKYYGDIALPAGEYDAVRVEIGEAQGENWWCVMFPPLCFVDGSISEDSTAQLVRAVGENAAVLTPAASDTVKIRFKMADFFQSASHLLKEAFRRI